MIIKDDFLISKDNPVPSSKSKVYGKGSKKGITIVWQDERLGGAFIKGDYAEIFFQSFDSLRMKIGGNRRLDITPEWRVRVVGGIGYFDKDVSFLWNTGDGLYFCKYSNKGELKIKRKRIISDEEFYGNLRPDKPVGYSTNEINKGLVCFTVSCKNEGDRVYALCINSCGEVVLPIFTVDSMLPGTPYFWNAKGAISDRAFGVIYWEGGVEYRIKIYTLDGKFIDKIILGKGEGTPYIEMVMDTIYVVWCEYPEMSVWLEKYVLREGGVSREFKEMLSKDALWSSNMQVAFEWWDRDEGPVEIPSLVVMTAWHDWDEKKIKCRVYSGATGGEIAGGSFSPSVSDTATPDFSLFYGAGRFHIAYVDDSNRVIDVATYLTPDTELVFAGPQVVSDDSCGEGWSDARLAVNSNGDFAILYWSPEGKAFVKFFDRDGNQISKEIDISTLFTTRCPSMIAPMIAMDNERNLMVIALEDWLETLPPIRIEFYGLIVKPSGEIKRFNIGRYPEELYIGDSYLTCNSKGDFLFLWDEFPFGSEEERNVIKGRFFDANGRPKTDVFTLKFPLGPIHPTGADVFENGGAVVAAAMSNAARSWAVVIDSTGNPLTELIEFIRTYPVIACDGRNRWVMAGLNVKPNYMVFDRKGNVIKDLQVIDAYTFPWPSFFGPRQLWCDMDTSGRFIIYWTDFTEDANPDVRAQIFSRDGDPVSEIFEVHNPDAFPYEYQLSTWQGLGVTSDRIYFMWLDNRRIKGWDIYAKVTDWEYPTGIKEKRESKNLDIEYLGPHILIRFSLSFPQNLSIKLYDVSGRVVKSIFLKAKKGENTIEIEKNFPPGVYFLRIEGKEKEYSTKILIVKGK